MATTAPPIASAGQFRPTRPSTAELGPGILIAVKALIMLTTLTALAVPALHEFHGEAMTGRVLVYAVAVLVVPAGWLVCGRRSYPLVADSFLMAPLVFDLAGNSFHLYSRFDHYDKVAHLLGVAAAALFATALLRGYVSGRVAFAAVAVAGGLCIGIAIELFEFGVFTHPAATGIGAYQDTIGDLAMDMLGAVAAAAVSQASASSRRSKIGTDPSKPSMVNSSLGDVPEATTNRMRGGESRRYASSRTPATVLSRKTASSRSTTTTPSPTVASRRDSRTRSTVETSCSPHNATIRVLP